MTYRPTVTTATAAEWYARVPDPDPLTVPEERPPPTTIGHAYGAGRRIGYGRGLRHWRYRLTSLAFAAGLLLGVVLGRRWT